MLSFSLRQDFFLFDCQTLRPTGRASHLPYISLQDLEGMINTQHKRRQRENVDEGGKKNWRREEKRQEPWVINFDIQMQWREPVSTFPHPFNPVNWMQQIQRNTTKHKAKNAYQIWGNSLRHTALPRLLSVLIARVLHPVHPVHTCLFALAYLSHMERKVWESNRELVNQ